MSEQFLTEQLAKVAQDLGEIEVRLTLLKAETEELLARQAVLKRAQTNLRRQRGQIARHSRRDKEVVYVRDIQPFVDEYLADHPEPYKALRSLADRAGVSLGLMEKVRYQRSPHARIEFVSADKILTALGVGHLLLEDIEVVQKYPLTDA